VTYIVDLINADIDSNLLKWSEAKDVKTITERVNIQVKWQELLDSLNNPVDPPVERGAVTDPPPKEVKRTGGDRTSKTTEPK
jgi:hypothetical protein